MGRNPKKKVFVDNKDAAVDLARSVADVVEERAQTKIKMHQSKASAASVRANPERPRRSSSQSKLERAKALVAAQAAQAKREKAKQRKNSRNHASKGGQNAATSDSARVDPGEKLPASSGGQTKKRVTFG
ncbi:hypothetical protein C8Q76DRAFT_732435 [Earliella scabrosa]|nr:hypothetical protein C8Q76DRAFT_732435 [Earliella scabrosa]